MAPLLDNAGYYFLEDQYIQSQLRILTDRIPNWWIWGNWVSPLMYAQEAASVNEFLGHSWDKVRVI